MLERFFPDEYYPSIREVPFDALHARGIRGLIIDIDNTLAPYDVPEPPEAVTRLLRSLEAKGFRICLFSNNGKTRVERFNASLGLLAVYKAGKPKKRGIRKAMSMLTLSAAETALIGDQLFTDIWGGNRCGLRTILLEPIAQRDEWTVRLKRPPEQFVLRAYKRRCSI